MNLGERIHFYHRAWRYRLRTERDELAFVLRSSLQGATVLDIGANRGIYSYWLHRQVGPQGQVIAFEPQPELCTELDKLKRAFRLNRLTIVPTALSSTSGQAELIRPPGHWGGASLHHAQREGMDVLPIAMTTLDAYFAQHPRRPVGFIKCDIEGHELSCLRGGERLLQEDRPTLLLECSDGHFEQVQSYLHGLGYRSYFLHRHRQLPVAELPQWRARLRPHYLNYVFQHEAQSARRAA